MFRTGGRSRHAWTVAALTMLAGVGITLAVGVLSGIFSYGLLLDLVSLWPFLLVPVGAWAYQLVREPRTMRATAIPSLLFLSWLVLAAAAHFSGWSALPSSSAELVGPTSEGVGSAYLSIKPVGWLQIEEGSGNSLYRVSFIRRGGQVGAPIATEAREEDLFQITIEENDSPIWFQYAGWAAELSSQVRWELDLAGDMRADLEGIEVGGLNANGLGVIALGIAEGPTQVRLEGDFELRLPADAPAAVTGVVEVPDDWVEIEGGFRSPEAGDGWQISRVGEGSLIISQP
ncbi:MAG TPA: hypothetical protein VID03_02990 [Acidimicrobiia bacterium]|jgi:hypothetical protein